jgi:hypothetical protein
MKDLKFTRTRLTRKVILPEPDPPEKLKIFFYPNPTYPKNHFTRPARTRKIKNIFLPEPDLPEKYFT